MEHPFYAADTAFLRLEVYEDGSASRVKIMPRVAKGEFIPDFDTTQIVQADGVIADLRKQFGERQCRSLKGFGYTGLTIHPKPGEDADVLLEAVVDRIKTLEASHLLGGEKVKAIIRHDDNYVKRLAAEARKRPTREEQVEHIIADESLTPAQRSMALRLSREPRER